MRKLFAALACALTLAACGVDKTWAPEAEVQSARFVAGPPPSITLYTVINGRNGSGAHSGLLINGSERVLFDPAGTFMHPAVPVRNDVHYGMSDRMVTFYLDYHTRDSASENFYLIESTLIVSPEVAEMVMNRAKTYGAVPKAYCASSISTILRGVPGFESLPSTMFPKKLGAAFNELPGVSYRTVTEATPLPAHGVTMVDKKGNQVN